MPSSTKHIVDKKAGKLPDIVVGIPVIYIEWCDAIADRKRWLSINDAKDGVKMRIGFLNKYVFFGRNKRVFALS